MPMTYIISVLLFVTHEHFFFMVDAMFISSFFYLVLLSFSLASIQLFHPTHGLFCFILCYLSWVYTFYIMFIPHCKYFFLSSCTRNMAHNAVNTRSQSLLHRKYTCTRPVRQMPFGVTTLKIEDTLLFLTFLTFRDHLHFFVGQSLPSSSSTVCFQLSVRICSYLLGCCQSISV